MTCQVRRRPAEATPAPRHKEPGRRRAGCGGSFTFFAASFNRQDMAEVGAEGFHRLPGTLYLSAQSSRLADLEVPLTGCSGFVWTFCRTRIISSELFSPAFFKLGLRSKDIHEFLLRAIWTGWGLGAQSSHTLTHTHSHTHTQLSLLPSSDSSSLSSQEWSLGRQLDQALSLSDEKLGPETFRKCPKLLN